MAPTEDERTLEINGERVPALGFGTWEMAGEDAEGGVMHALSLGYRHIDTAQMYENEEEVGRAIRASGVDRDELFLTTKLALDNVDRQGVVSSTGDSLTRLGVDVIDLLLIHWPSEHTPLEETLEAMEGLKAEGKIRRIGVSNFPPSHLARARAITEIFCNQVEYHPFLSQDKLLAAVRDEGLLFTAYSPLARGRVNDDETIRSIAEAHGRTPAQVTIRWLIQQRVCAIPKASSAEHREQNLEAFDFALTEDEMRRISALGGEGRIIDPSWAPEWERTAGSPA